MEIQDPTTTIQPSDASRNAGGEAGFAGWQSRLLPLMAGMLILLTAFFIVATLIQAWRMQRRIEEAGGKVPHIAEAVRLGGEGGLTLEEARWSATVRLEEYAIQRRYHQASLIIMTRVWIIYLGFVTGMILALVGAAFILGKIRESVSQFGADSSVWKFSITTASPGLILAVLGTVLMTITMIFRAEVTVTDAPLYVGREVRLTGGHVSGGTAPREPPAPVPDSAGQPKSQTLDDSALDKLEQEVEKRSGDTG